MASPPRSLVLSAGSLGDSLLTLLALRILENQGPVTVAGTPPYLGLGADLFGVSQMTPLDPLLQALLKPEPPPKEIIDFLSSFDTLYLFFKEKDEKLVSKLSSLGVGRCFSHPGLSRIFFPRLDGRGNFGLKPPSNGPWPRRIPSFRLNSCFKTLTGKGERNF